MTMLVCEAEIYRSVFLVALMMQRFQSSQQVGGVVLVVQASFVVGGIITSRLGSFEERYFRKPSGLDCLPHTHGLGKKNIFFFCSGCH